MQVDLLMLDVAIPERKRKAYRWEAKLAQEDYLMNGVGLEARTVEGRWGSGRGDRGLFRQGRAGIAGIETESLPLLVEQLLGRPTK